VKLESVEPAHGAFASLGEILENLVLFYAMVVANDELRRVERRSLPAEPGMPERVDCEYGRCGVADVFMAFEPLAAKRVTKVIESRSAVDFATFMRDLFDVRYPTAEKVVVVMDSLNTHTTASFYKAFEPA
jgi:hypothetical protein